MNDYVLYHLPTTPMDILSFWFSDKSCPKWFAKDPSFDAVVSARYGAVLQAAKRGELFQWRETIRGRLAEIIVLDQFSRNIHRGTATAFESDAQALVLAQEAVRDETRFELTPDEKAFLYMPFMHSESPVIHDEGLKLFSEVGLESHLAYEEEHRRVIQRFGILENGNRVATLDLGNRLINYRWGTSRYQVRQLVGTCNSRPAPEVAKAVGIFVDEINRRIGGSGASLTTDHEAISPASAVAASG
jgi:uncharacterized protein (DUF924 family)